MILSYHLLTVTKICQGQERHTNDRLEVKIKIHSNTKIGTLLTNKKLCNHVIKLTVDCHFCCNEGHALTFILILSSLGT